MQAETLKSVIKVLLVEDHPMFRERLASVISKRGDMSVCGEADNVHDALRARGEPAPGYCHRGHHPPRLQRPRSAQGPQGQGDRRAGARPLHA